MSAAAGLALAPTPFSALAPVLRPVLRDLLAASSLAVDRPLRVLEAGSSGGLLTALLRETRVLIAQADFADPSPATLEVAAARARHWNHRCQFINAPLSALVPRPHYDLILTWDLVTSTGLTPAQIEDCSGRLQTRPGWWLAFQEAPQHPYTMFGVHQYERQGLHLYRGAPGRPAWSACGWQLR